MTAAFFKRIFETYVAVISADKSIPAPFIKDAAQDMTIRSWRNLVKYESTIRTLYGYCRRLYSMERPLLQNRYRPVFYDYIEDFEIYRIQGFLPTDSDTELEMVYSDVLRELGQFSFPVYLDTSELLDEAARFLRGEQVETGSARVLGRLALARCIGAGHHLAKQARQEWADAVFALHGTG